MSQPENNKSSRWTKAVHAKTIFYTEGNPIALLVTNRAGRRKASTQPFASAEAALAWCRGNAAILVYCPVALERN